MDISVEPSHDGADPFNRLVQEHQQYSHKLDAILSQRYLSEEEQMEVARLKKLKLKLKDQMEGHAHPSQASR